MFFLFLFTQGKSHRFALKNLAALYWPILEANWTYLTPLIFLNLAFVPPMVSGLFFLS